jgi:hypothetical protein
MTGLLQHDRIEEEEELVAAAVSGPQQKYLSSIGHLDAWILRRLLLDARFFAYFLVLHAHLTTGRQPAKEARDKTRK